jgi:hypothetical protein
MAPHFGEGLFYAMISLPLPIRMASSTPGNPSASGTGFGGRAIDILKSAANLEPVKKTVILGDGKTEFTMYCTPLVAAERDKARKNAKNDDAGAFAMQLLVLKAKDENNQPLFAVGDIPALKHEIEDADLQKIIGAVIGDDDDDADLDQKK